MTVSATVSSTIGGAATTARRNEVQEAVWRVAVAALVGLSLLAFVFGTAWDVQRHVNVGRDRILTAPHQLLLAGIAMSGLISLAAVLRDSLHARQGRGGDDANNVGLFGVFRAPLGFFVAGFGALLAAIAFPLDDYWHTLYGIDVTLWAPFHVMIGMSMVLVGLGGLITLSSELHRLPGGHMRIVAQLSFAALFAFTFGTLLILLSQAVNHPEGLTRIGSYEWVLYPMLLAAALPLAVMTPALVLPMPGAATLVALIFVALRQALYLFVPWAVEVTVAAEGLSYRAPMSVIHVPFSYPTAILGVALLVDIARWWTRGRRSTMPWLAAASVAGAVAATAWDQPWAYTLPRLYYPNIDVQAVYLNALPFAVASALAGTAIAFVIARGLAGARQ